MYLGGIQQFQNPLHTVWMVLSVNAVDVDKV
jgi:hypothetical protein